jgi:hypothetical protein
LVGVVLLDYGKITFSTFPSGHDPVQIKCSCLNPREPPIVCGWGITHEEAAMNLRAELATKQDAVASVPCVIGLDLGGRRSRYCVLDGAGVIIEEDRVRSNAEAPQERFECPSSLVLDHEHHPVRIRVRDLKGKVVRQRLQVDDRRRKSARRRIELAVRQLQLGSADGCGTVQRQGGPREATRIL